jgi:hypothetical protein
LQIPGEKKSIQTRNVALLVAAKNYLITGQWNGDWKEFRAMCVDQNCYDRTNISAYMKSDLFKTASSEENITLSAAGQKAAETLLKQIAHPTD